MQKQKKGIIVHILNLAVIGAIIYGAIYAFNHLFPNEIHVRLTDNNVSITFDLTNARRWERTTHTDVSYSSMSFHNDPDCNFNISFGEISNQNVNSWLERFYAVDSEAVSLNNTIWTRYNISNNEWQIFVDKESTRYRGSFYAIDDLALTRCIEDFENVMNTLSITQ